MSSGAAHPPVEKIYGPLLLGSLLATAFYSLMCMQAYRYFVHYQKDRSFLKVLVGTIWLMNTLHETMVISSAYRQLISGLRNELAYLDGHPEIFFKPLLTAFVAVPVQGFFAYRIYIFTRKSFIAPLLWFIAGMIQIVCSLLVCSKGLYISNGTLQAVPLIQLGRNPIRFLATLIISVSVAVDVLIAVSMTILLARECSSPQLPKTSRMLQRLILFAVNTGAWSAAFATASLILVYVYPATVFSAIVGTPVCSVYSNTLLANLNARESFRDTQTWNGGRSGMDTYGFALAALPASSIKPREESRTSLTTRKTADVDDWKIVAVAPYVADTSPPAISRNA